MDELHKVKFLIIRFSSIGDIVLTTPVVRMLKEQIQGAEIHYLTKPKFKNVVANNPYIDKIHTLRENFDEMIEILRNESYDYIIDLHHNLRTSRVKRRMGLPAFSFDKLNWEKWLRVNFNIHRLPDVHIVDRYLATTSVFDVQDDGKGLEYFLQPEDDVPITNFPDVYKNGFIAVAIGAQHYTKRLPNEKLASLCGKIKYPMILLGDQNDSVNAEEIIRVAKEQNPEIAVINACGVYSLNQSASIVKQSHIVLTHDTGLMHIAAAFGKRIISVWGNTIPEFGMSPYRAHPDSLIVEVQNLKCRPCTKIGFRICPKKHFKCMNHIDEQIIISKIEQVFSNHENRN